MEGKLDSMLTSFPHSKSLQAMMDKRRRRRESHNAGKKNAVLFGFTMVIVPFCGVWKKSYSPNMNSPKRTKRKLTAFIYHSGTETKRQYKWQDSRTWDTTTRQSWWRDQPVEQGHYSEEKRWADQTVTARSEFLSAKGARIGVHIETNENYTTTLRVTYEVV